ncbi:MAG: amidohydrolase family protein [Solidesulfovibrio sp.]
MGVIDFRFRPNTQETLDGIRNSAMFKGLCQSIDFDTMKGQSLKDVVAELTHHEVVRAVITGRDCQTTYGSPSNNASVTAFVRQFPDMFIGFVGLDPHKGMDAVAELVQAVAEDGFGGASIDPYLARIPADHAKYYPLYAKCCELGVPMVITTGPATLVPGAVMDHASPRHIDCVARDFPQLSIVISHGGYPYVGEAILTAQRNRNVYLDLSEYERAPMAEAYIQAANTMIPEKVLFASAHPFVDFKQSLKLYQALPFTPEVRRAVMHDNAARLLGLSLTKATRA